MFSSLCLFSYSDQFEDSPLFDFPSFLLFANLRRVRRFRRLHCSDPGTLTGSLLYLQSHICFYILWIYVMYQVKYNLFGIVLP